MTAVPALLADLRRRNVRVSAEGDDRLRLEGPAGALTPEVRAEVAAHKVAILETLGGTSGYGEPDSVISVTPSVPQPGNPSTLDHWRSLLQEATDWAGLYAVLNDAQEAFADGSLAGPEVEALAREAGLRSRSLPEHVPDGRTILAADLLRSDDSTDACPTCAQSRWWTERHSGRRVCRVCHPPPNPEAER